MEGVGIVWGPFQGQFYASTAAESAVFSQIIDLSLFFTLLLEF
jgi:hypothetical protein